MIVDKHIYKEYLEILKEELVPALGCTEPIAIAYGAAKAREILGTMPEAMTVWCSGNIIKNVKAVIVPTTGDMKGIETSAILGAVGGNAEKKLEVLTDITDEDLKRTRELLKKKICHVELLEGVSNLQIIVEEKAGEDTALVEIAFSHTNIVRIEKNGKTIFAKECKASVATETDRSLLNLRSIYEFACSVEMEEVQTLLEQQLAYNMSIAREGLTKNYGANVGSTILKRYGDDVRNRVSCIDSF